jgi:hypothetical protein
VPKLAGHSNARRQGGPGGDGVIDAERGIDELTTATANRVRGFGARRDVEGEWHAEDFGLERAPFSHLTGGDLTANLAIMDAILAGKAPAGLLDTIVLNAAVAMWIVGRVSSVREGLAPAREQLRGGEEDRRDAGFYRSCRKYFGTDGVRGLYGGPLINEAFAARLGFAATTWLPRKGRVVVGRDAFSAPRSKPR